MVQKLQSRGNINLQEFLRLLDLSGFGSTSVPRRRLD